MQESTEAIFTYTNIYFYMYILPYKVSFTFSHYM